MIVPTIIIAGQGIHKDHLAKISMQRRPKFIDGPHCVSLAKRMRRRESIGHGLALADVFDRGDTTPSGICSEVGEVVQVVWIPLAPSYMPPKKMSQICGYITW